MRAILPFRITSPMNYKVKPSMNTLITPVKMPCATTSKNYGATAMDIKN